MCRFNRSQRAAVDEGLSNAEVDPVREAGLGGGSLAPGFAKAPPGGPDDLSSDLSAVALAKAEALAE